MNIGPKDEFGLVLFSIRNVEEPSYMFFWKKKTTRIAPTLEQDSTQPDNIQASAICSLDDIMTALQQLKDGDFKFFFEPNEIDDDVREYGDDTDENDVNDEDGNYEVNKNLETISQILTSMAFSVSRLTKEYSINSEQYKQNISEIIETHYSELSEQFYKGVKLIKYDIFDGQEWLKEKDYFFENVIYTKFGNDVENTISEVRMLFSNTESADFREHAEGTYPEYADDINKLDDGCIIKIREALSEDEIFTKLISLAFYAGVKQLSLNMIYEILEKDLTEDIKKRTRQIEPSTDSIITPLDYEKICMNALLEIEWSAELTKPTGDQGADIIAEKNGKSLVVQCKYYSGGVGTKAIQEVLAARTYYCADYAAVVTNAYFTPGAIELAKRGNVLLLNESELQQIDSLLRNN